MLMWTLNLTIGHQYKAFTNYMDGIRRHKTPFKVRCQKKRKYINRFEKRTLNFFNILPTCTETDSDSTKDTRSETQLIQNEYFEKADGLALRTRD